MEKGESAHGNRGWLTIDVKNFQCLQIISALDFCDWMHLRENLDLVRYIKIRNTRSSKTGRNWQWLAWEGSCAIPSSIRSQWTTTFVQSPSFSLGQRPDEKEFLAFLTSVNRSPLVVVDQLIEWSEFALPNAVHCIFHVDSKVFVPTGSFQRYGKVADLECRMFLVFNDQGEGASKHFEAYLSLADRWNQLLKFADRENPRRLTKCKDGPFSTSSRSKKRDNTA